MNDMHDVIPWVDRAEEDFQLSNASIRRKQPLTYGATFHAQQCVEKYLKAILVFRQISFPRTHDLAALNRLCLKNGVQISFDEDDLDTLSAYAVEVRYPGMQPSVDEAKVAIRMARKARKLARKFLGL